MSGGLDSILAVKVLQDQDIEVHGICFVSNFFGCQAAREAAEENGIEFKVVDISKELLNIVKNPSGGVGKNVNPCIDCHSLMLRKAKAYIDNGEYDLLATGEILGQRPFSQNKHSLMAIQEKVGMDVLRPLSAQGLPKTEMERRGSVDRERLLDIEGRSREVQEGLIKKYQIKNFSSPAGGCLLTDPQFGKRLSEMLLVWPECNTDDVELLKYGRVFWFHLQGEYILAVVGRHQEDNDKLEELKKSGDVILELEDITGPLTLIRSKGSKINFRESKISLEIPEEFDAEEHHKEDVSSVEEALKAAALLTGWYKTEARGSKVQATIQVSGF